MAEEKICIEDTNSYLCLALGVLQSAHEVFSSVPEVGEWWLAFLFPLVVRMTSSAFVLSVFKLLPAFESRVWAASESNARNSLSIGLKDIYCLIFLDNTALIFWLMVFTTCTKLGCSCWAGHFKDYISGFIGLGISNKTSGETSQK